MKPMDQNHATEPGHKKSLDWAAVSLTIYNALNLLGVYTLHYARRMERRLRRWTRRSYNLLWGGLMAFGRLIRRQWQSVIRHNWVEPFRHLLSNWRSDFVSLYQALASRDWEAVKDKLFDLPRTFRLIGNVASYVLPVLGCGLFVATFQYYDNQTYALQVEYNGQQIGYIENESVFAEAEKAVQERIITEGYESPEDSVPQYTLMVVEEEQLASVEELTNRIIEVSGNEIQEASGLYVDGQFIGATTDGDGLVLELKSLLDETRATADEDAEVSFVQDVKVNRALYPVDSIVDLSNISAELTKEVAAARVYVIKPGDTPYDVANEYDVPLDTLLRNNEEVVKRFLPGQSLLIEAAVPLLERQVSVTVKEENSINFKTEQVLNNNLEKNFTRVKQNGQTGKEEVTYRVTYVDGFEVERTVVDRVTLEEPVNAVLEVGTLMPAQYLNNISGGSVGGFIWPVDGGYISCPIWGYAGHTGTDIATKTGTAVRASADGIVTYSGWRNSYGYTVIINHGNGISTLYAHNSQIHVVAGQAVQQGQLIASSGATGNVSGPHCHFEIIINNSYKDARQYIGYTYPGR